MLVSSPFCKTHEYIPPDVKFEANCNIVVFSPLVIISCLAGIPSPVPNDDNRVKVTLEFVKSPLLMARISVMLESDSEFVLAAGTTRQTKFDRGEAAPETEENREYNRIMI